MDFVQSAVNPNELLALLKFKVIGSSTIKPMKLTDSEIPTKKRCYEFLQITSRSFAAVIQSLDEKLRHSVCIFYLVLRALDTVEDDMTIPTQVKVPMLKNFYKNLTNPNWKYMESKEKDRAVLEEFPVISAEFLKLQPVFQEVILDICEKMGAGMVVYLDKAPGSLNQWDEYCHYVAGLVGIGLSRLFSVSGLEAPGLGQQTDLSNSMGLFLQKTNIIRDYLEDVLDGREFWPQQVWSKYCTELSSLKAPDHQSRALQCLNELVTDALRHVPDCFKYMEQLHNQSVFNFCAIPQVMAVATLERCYNNPAVFKSVVKIRKGEAVKLMMEASDIEKVKAIFTYYVNEIKKRIPATDPSAEKTRSLTATILQLTHTTKSSFSSSGTYFPLYLSLGLTVSAYFWPYIADLGSVIAKSVA